MAASATVHQLQQSCNSLVPRHGVLTLFGYGISVTVDRGHLTVKDGIGGDRSEARLPRVNHGLRRLVVIGSDGFVSLAALRWLADQEVAFVMLERDGSVLATTGPVHSSDARLRRAQSLASTNGVALEISKELIRQKLTAQEQLVREKLNDSVAANLIATNRAALDDARTVDALRLSESRAAYAYWSAWHNLAVNFPRRDLRRVPEHWRTFGARISPLTGSPRLSVNPPNAMLNYLYALLESECRLAAAALGLDPGLGFMHVDSRSRDSLACDLMEPVRPLVDAYVFDWISREPLCKEWFFEQRNGNCRLMGSFACRLTETTSTWRQAVAPIAEWLVHTLWPAVPKRPNEKHPATRLTQDHRREARGLSPTLPLLCPPKPLRICLGCGAAIMPGKNYCASCGVFIAREELINAAKRGRVAAQSPEAQDRRAKTQAKHAAQARAWTAAGASPIDLKTYQDQVQSRLREVTLAAIVKAIGVSISYASDIRAGRRVPHQRHWQTLASLVDFRAN